jgi:hypothetical protein
MFARTVFRASKVATPSQIARASLPKVARATFTASTRRCTPPEVIAEKEVMQSSYSGGEVQRSTIIVGEEASQKVSPLTQNVYNTMPKTMQSLSLMGKTVVVTGYVIILFTKTISNNFTVVPVVSETQLQRHALRLVQEHDLVRCQPGARRHLCC